MAQRKYLDKTGLTYFWGKIKTYVTNAVKVTGVKGNAESSYRTGNVNITADNVKAITKDLSGNTLNLRRPSTLQGVNDVTIDSKINTLRANRLAFLPADQVIIEKTTDGGATWVDAGIADVTKVGLFSETRPSVTIPLLNGKKSPLCGLRFTITAMKYNVPAGTAETAKYSYWNKDHIKSTERYNQLKEMYFWVSTSGGYINVKVERATGANPTNWSVISNDTSFNMTGYSGNDYISFSQGVFGGGTTQVNNYWNYRITFMTDDYIPASPYDGYTQSIMEIRGYGDTWWTAGNEYAANDKIYTHDYLKNVTFPAQVTATQFNGSATKVNNHTVNSDVPANAKFTDTTYSQADNHTTGISIANHSVATIYGVGSTTTSVTGVSGSVTGSHVKSGGNGTAPTLGTAFTVPNVTAKGSGSFTSGTFFGGSFTQGTDSFTANTPTVINTSKFSGGSFTRGTFSGGSGSFTSGAFNGGSGSFSATVSNHVMSFSHTHTAATHAADSHTHTAATHAADSFTAASFQSGFYTAGTAASFTQGTDSFSPATHGADSHTHTAPTLGTAFTIPNVTSVGSASNWVFEDVTVPKAATSATTVPIKNSSATTVATAATHTITDNGHTHTLS